MNQPIAIQSWCFRHFKTIPALIEQLKAAGVNAVELCGSHADFADKSKYVEIVDQFKIANVKIVAIGVEYMQGDREKDRPRFEFCKAAGIDHMSISFKPEAMFDGVKAIDALAAEYDMTLGIHNHGGYDWLGNPTMLEYIFKHTSDRIGLHMDTAWMIDAKQNPVQVAQTFGKRLTGVHVKDFIYSREREPSDVVLGEGILDLPAFMSTLKEINFSGPLVIEYEGDETNPGPALKGCVEKLKALL